MKNTVAVYPGSFDPPTNGHVDIITRSSKMFSKVIVAITYNYSKKHYFSLEDRISMMKESVKHLKNVKVESFSGLLADYLEKINSFYVIRGLRALSDFGKSSLINAIDANYEREIASLNGDFKKFVPKPVYEKMKLKKI